MLSRPPRAPLDECIALLWTHERGALAHAREWNLPSGGADMVIALHAGGLRRFDGLGDVHGQWFRGGVLQGLQERPLLRDTSAPSAVAGVQFKAGGLARWLGRPALEFTNHCVSLGDLFGAALEDLREQLAEASSAALRLDWLEHWLARALTRRAAPAGFASDPWLGPVLGALQCADAPRIATLQASTGLSAERFIGRFEQAVGMTPKRYARLARFRRVLGAAATAQAPGWSALAADFGFADQAHLSREFLHYAGCSPTQWRPIAPDQPAHRAA